jgi:hypothetical protein
MAPCGTAGVLIFKDSSGTPLGDLRSAIVEDVVSKWQEQERLDWSISHLWDKLHFFFQVLVR